MSGLIATLLRPLRRARPRRRAWAAQPPPARDHRPAARALCDAIDRAMALGLWEHADRLADAAARLAPCHLRLAERLARLRLAQGDAERALMIIEGLTMLPASLRVLRAVCLAQVGRAPEAHADLHRWSARASAPLNARLLLAHLEWDAGDQAAAMAALRENLRHLEDPQTLQMLALLALDRQRSDQAAGWIEQLRAACAGASMVPDVEIFCASLCPPGRAAQPAPATGGRQMAVLAMELVSHERVIHSLVEAQRRQYQPSAARLLSDAIERALPDLVDQLPGIEALARLAQMRGDQITARRWARRGLAINPMAVSLALIARGDRTHEPRGQEPAQTVVGRIDQAASDSPPTRSRAA